MGKKHLRKLSKFVGRIVRDDGETRRKSDHWLSHECLVTSLSRNLGMLLLLMLLLFQVSEEEVKRRKVGKGIHRRKEEKLDGGVE